MRPPKPRPPWLTQGRKLRQGWDGGAGSWPRGAGWAQEARTDPVAHPRPEAGPATLTLRSPRTGSCRSSGPPPGLWGSCPAAPEAPGRWTGPCTRRERTRFSPGAGPTLLWPAAHPSSCGGTLGCRAGLGGREAARACSAGERRVLWEQAAPPDREAPSGDTQVARRPRTPCRKIHGPRGGRGLQSPLRA